MIFLSLSWCTFMMQYDCHFQSINRRWLTKCSWIGQKLSSNSASNSSSFSYHVRRLMNRVSFLYSRLPVLYCFIMFFASTLRVFCSIIALDVHSVHWTCFHDDEGIYWLFFLVTLAVESWFKPESGIVGRVFRFDLYLDHIYCIVWCLCDLLNIIK